MKILLLNYFDAGSGAAIATERLLMALRQSNINVELGVLEKKNANVAIILLQKKNLNQPRFYCIIKRLCGKFKSRITRIANLDFSTTNTITHSTNHKSFIDVNYINNSDYDIIHFHWVNYDMISIEDIPKIKKPIVWTLHDSWVFCGAEHHPNILENDTRFIEGYTKFNKPKTTSGIDVCRRTWERKRTAWKNCKFIFISPSNYMMETFNNSALFSNSKNICTVIPNIVPENIFKPNNKNAIKEVFQIPKDKKIIGFGAAHGITNKKSIKGGYLLLEAIKKINNNANYSFVLFGNADDSFVEEIAISYFSTGSISNPYILAGIYNLCDVFVCPSLLESFGMVCLESLFCGTPVTAFNTGGIPDIVEHKRTGYLAKCFDAEDLCNGILYCIDNYDELSRNSLEMVRTEFANDGIVRKHIEVYKSILNNSQTCTPFSIRNKGKQ